MIVSAGMKRRSLRRFWDLALLGFLAVSCTNTEIEYREMPPPPPLGFSATLQPYPEPNHYAVSLAFQGMGDRPLALLRIDQTKVKAAQAKEKEKDKDKIIDPFDYAETQLATNKGEAAFLDENVEPSHDYEYWVADRALGFRYGPARVSIPRDTVLTSQSYHQVNNMPRFHRIFVSGGNTDIITVRPQLIGKELVVGPNAELNIKPPPENEAAVGENKHPQCYEPLLLVVDRLSGPLRLRAEEHKCFGRDEDLNPVLRRGPNFFIWIKEETTEKIEWDHFEPTDEITMRCILVGERALLNQGYCDRGKDLYRYVQSKQN